MGAVLDVGDTVALDDVRFDGSGQSQSCYLHVLTALKLDRRGRSNEGQGHSDQGDEQHCVFCF